jgi:type I restriction enzyme S subunit
MSLPKFTWPTTTVGSLCDQIRGVSYSKGDARNEPDNGLVPILRANNIHNDGMLAFDDLIYVPRSVVAATQYIREHDIVIAASSGSLSVVGKAAQARSDWSGGFGAFCKVLRPNTKVEPRYLAYFFRTEHYRHRISQLAAGANINNLRNEHLDDLEIPLPPLLEQKRIADILDKADAIRRKRQDFSEAIFTLTDAIFQELVGDPVTNPMGWERMTYKEAPIEIIDGDRGKEYPSSGDFDDDGFCLFLSAKNVTKRGFNFDDKSFITKEKDCSMRKGKLQRHDVVITTRGTVGNVAYFGETVPFDHIRINSGMLILRAEPRTIIPRFLSLLLQSSMFQRQVEQMRSGQGQRTLSA